MKCPHCTREINEDAKFCGFCGNTMQPKVESPPVLGTQESQIENKTSEADLISDQENSMPKDDNTLEKKSLEHSEVVSTFNLPPRQTENEEKKQNKEFSSKEKKKKRIGLKVFIIFLAFSILSGSALGFATASGMIDIKKWISHEKFRWTDPSEANIEEENPESNELQTQTEQEKIEAELNRKKSDESSEHEKDSKSEDPSESDRLQTTGREDQVEETDPHYIVDIGKISVIIDDKSHFWTAEQMEKFLKTAKRSASNSKHTIMVVTANETFGKTKEDFCKEYFDQAIQQYIQNEAPISKDGYLLFINTQTKDFFWSLYGEAKISDEKTKEWIFNDLVIHMVDEEYEEAVIQLIEKTSNKLN